MQSINRWTAACSMAAALVVLPWSTDAAAATATFANGTSITIPDSGDANPFPSNINVVGLSGEVVGVTLQLNNVTHSCLSDLAVVLVAPNGNWLPVMTGFDPCTDGTINLQLRFADGFPFMTEGTISGTYSPNQKGGISTPPPGDICQSAEVARNGGKNKSVRQAKFAIQPLTTFAAFNGPAAADNGTWSLYVKDCAEGDSGAFAGGWLLTFDLWATTVPTLGEAGLVGLGLLLFGFGARTLRRRA